MGRILRVSVLDITLVSVVSLALLAPGCSCDSGASRDAGLFRGVDAPGYEPVDSGPRPPEPCAVPTRRVRFSLGEGSIRPNRLWASGSRAWVYAGGGLPGTPPSLRLFDLDAERELDVEMTPTEEDEFLGVFESSGDFEVVVRTADASPRVRYFDSEGRLTGEPDQPLGLASRPLLRLDDGRYVGFAVDDSVTPAVPAALELAAPAGDVQRIELGFETSSDFLSALRWNGELLVGVGYEDEARRVVRFEVDLDTAAVRLATLAELAEGVRLAGAYGHHLRLWASRETASVALSYLSPEGEFAAEVLWWPIGGDSITRQVVRPAAILATGVLALGGDIPRQTLVLTQASDTRVWVTAARIRAAGEIEGGAEPIGVFTAIHDGAAWEPSEGTAGLALVSQRELEVLFVCEGVL